MKTQGLLKLGKFISLAMIVASCQKEKFIPDQQNSLTDASIASSLAKGGGSTATISVFATGLNNPRGLKFGPDDYLYVAEGGVGGTNSTAGQCTQVIPPIGPYKGSSTGGRISKISSKGVRTTVTDQLPTTQNAFAEVSGAADIAFVGNDLYALISGAGCSHGVSSMPNGIVKISRNGSITLLANLSNWSLHHPVANPEEDDYEPDGDWYSMVYMKGNFYAVEANHGELVKITPTGAISRVIDISASQGHIVPTALAFNDNFYVGNLNPFPIINGASKIFKITPAGNISISASGFTTILGLVTDKKDRMYVLQNTTGFPFPTPTAGSIIRVDRNGNKETIATGLSLPTGMTMGPDGNLYVSNVGFGPTSIGGGQILKITLPKKDHDD